MSDKGAMMIAAAIVILAGAVFVTSGGGGQGRYAASSDGYTLLDTQTGDVYSFKGAWEGKVLEWDRHPLKVAK